MFNFILYCISVETLIANDRIPHWMYNMCMWGMNLGIFGTLILVCKESGDIFYSYDLINPPNSQKSSESQANWNKQASRKCSSSSLLHSLPLSIYKTDGSPRHWLAPNHETHLWVATKKTSRCLWAPPRFVPVLHAAVMGNEPAPAFLKRKHKAEFNQEVNNELQGKSTSHSPVS